MDPYTLNPYRTLMDPLKEPLWYPSLKAPYLGTWTLRVSPTQRSPERSPRRSPLTSTILGVPYYNYSIKCSLFFGGGGVRV